MSSTKTPSGKRRTKAKAATAEPVPPVEEPSAEAEAEALSGEFIAKGETSQDLTVIDAQREAQEDEEVVERVEHLNKGVGWVLISAGIIGLVVPGVLGTPFLIMGALALWPGNRKTVERWRKGHSPKIFHGSMKQINRFLDDLEKRYPRIEKKK
jgi:hypothetical protein